MLDAMGDAAIGMITSFHYSAAHDSPENKAFTTAYAKAFPKDRANFVSVAGYDGMHLIDMALAKTKGDASAGQCQQQFAEIFCFQRIRNFRRLEKRHCIKN